MKTVKKLFRHKKGIDTILAALLMVVIVVVASVMVYAWSTGLLGGLLVTPQTGKEALNLEQSSFASNNMNVTLYLRNSGSASISLVTYYVKDSAGDQYSRTGWSGPSGVTPNALAQPNIGINTVCPAPTCTYTPATSGSTGFTFVSGNQYTVVIVTSRNNQFTFTIVR